MRTLGIDPGIATLGFGFVEETNSGSAELVYYGCIKTSKIFSAHERLFKIHSELQALIKEFEPDYVAVERLFFCSNSKTAISVGEARGVILLAAAQSHRLVAEYTPLQVKLAITGYGKADKNQVQQMVKKLLKLKDIPKPDCHLPFKFV